MRVIGYVRLSRERDESTSVERQRQSIEQACGARGYDLVDVVSDVNVSATKTRLDRPGLNSVRKLVHDGQADLVMVWRLDRLCRNVGDFSTLLDEGLQIASATEPIDTTTPMGRAMAEVLQVFARLEADTIGLRVADTVNHLRTVGRFPGGPVPYGYVTAPGPDNGRVLVPNPVQADNLRAAAERILEGHSIRSTAQWMNSTGRLTQRGGEWTTDQLQKVLTRPSTYGRMQVKGAYVLDDDGLPAVTHEPILPLSTLHALERIFAKNKVKETRRRSHSRLLSGILICSGCGEPLHVHYSGDRPSYTCRAHVTSRSCPNPVAISAVRSEDEIVKQVMSQHGQDKVYRLITEPSKTAEVSDIERAITEVTDAMKVPGADIPTLATRLQTLHNALQTHVKAPQRPVQSKTLLGVLQDLYNASEGDTQRQRALLQVVLTKVTVLPAEKRRWEPERLVIEKSAQWGTLQWVEGM